jgi:hypothetical protein
MIRVRPSVWAVSMIAAPHLMDDPKSAPWVKHYIEKYNKL